MGLLQKAASAATGGTSAPAGSPGQHVTPLKGLLQRSAETILLPETPSGGEAAAEEAASGGVETMSPAEITSFISAELHALPESLEIPSQIFSVIKKRLRIAKGCLLLYDPLRLVFAPWASFGYDQTTLHRMRIPLGANESLNAIANGPPIAISGAREMARFQRFFSSREYFSLSKIVLSPLIIEGALAGMILITDAAPPIEDEGELLACLGAVSRTAAPLLRKARAEKLKSTALPSLHATESCSQQLARFLSSESSAGKAFLFALLNLEGYVKELAALHEHIDPFRLREDLRAMLGSFVADLGTLIPLADGRFLIGVQDLAARDLDLLLHQLRSFFAGIFGESGIPRGLPDSSIQKARRFPDDGSDIEELASFFCS